MRRCVNDAKAKNKRVRLAALLLAPLAPPSPDSLLPPPVCRLHSFFSRSPSPFSLISYNSNAKKGLNIVHKVLLGPFCEAWFDANRRPAIGWLWNGTLPRTFMIGVALAPSSSNTLLISWGQRPSTEKDDSKRYNYNKNYFKKQRFCLWSKRP